MVSKDITAIWRSLCLSFLFFFATCEKTEYEMYEPVLNVYCVLRNDLARQRIIVDRTYKIDEVAEYDLEDVMVILSGGGICDTLAALSDTMGFFETTKDFPILAETTYQLMVSATGLDTLTGLTLVPTFEISSPDDGDTVNYWQDTITILKNRPEDFFAISYIYFDSILGDTFDFEYWIMSQDSTRLDIPIDMFFPYYEAEYRLKIFKADTNYSNNLLNVEEIDSFLFYGVVGGAGLFGSIWAESLNIYLDTTQNIGNLP